MRVVGVGVTLLALAGPALPEAAPLAGQEPLGQALFTGVVYDSLTGRVLSGAEVSVGDGLATTRTDAEGRFSVSVPPGEYPVAFSHRALSSWGALRHPLRLRLEAGRTLSATLATASPATVLARACGGSGMVVGGVVRDILTLVPLAGALVEVQVPGGSGLRSRQVTASSDGGWFVCLPDGSTVAEAHARLGTARSRAVGVDGEGAVRKVDLYVQVSEPAQVVGTVVDGASTRPLEGVVVDVVGTRLRTVTGGDGRFAFRGVPPGLVELAVERLGYGRSSSLVRAEGGSTAEVTFELFSRAIAVDSVVVTVAGGSVDRNRMDTRFDGLTRAEIDALLPRAVAFDDLLRNAYVPGLRVREVTYMRASGVEQRGLCIELSRRSSSASRQCDMVEVYVNDVRVPNPEAFLENLAPASVDHIQIMTPGTASIAYLGSPRSRNGILLIWTRTR